MIDEPLIVPFSPGEALTRLAQIIGVVARDENLSAHWLAPLTQAQAQLTTVLGTGEQTAIQATFTEAQSKLSTLYHEFQDDAVQLAALGFPSPELQANPFLLSAPDPASVLTTFTLHGKQVLTSLAFSRAPGATGYWLHVVRYWEENGETQRIEDPILESPAPLFARVKLPVGKQILRIKARNPSTSTISGEFEIEVPDLTGK